VLNHPGAPHVEIERPHPPRYGPVVQEALHLVWLAADRICTKRLVPFLPTLVESLERHGHLQLSPEVRTQLLTISSATTDRRLASLSSAATHSLQVVGYDRFSGEAAALQLTELHRALRLYVNIFQPSMKLQSKQREGSRVHRKYDAAQTPLARLCTVGVLEVERVHALERVAQILDPLQLLSQLEQLQKTVWRHAILPTVQPQHTPEHATMHFPLERAAPHDASPEEQVEAEPLPLPKRRHKKYEKSRRPHAWRSRPDPFEGFWDQITAWLLTRSVSRFAVTRGQPLDPAEE
jgi:hypothetical protein